MGKASVVALLVLATGCSGGGGTAGIGGTTATAQPTLTSPSAPRGTPTPSSAPAGARQTAVPAEKNPPGDIPDNVAYVRYSNAVGRYSFTHPEGWAETTTGSTVTYTDKLNGVHVMLGTLTAAPTVDSATKQDVPALMRSQAAFALGKVTAVSVPGGMGVRIVFRRNSAPDPVTGRQYRDEVERYELVAAGREVVVELFGAVGSDNVDAYRTMITSLKLA